MDRDDIKAIFLMRFRADHHETLTERRIEEIKVKRPRQKLKYSEIIHECKHCGKKFTPTSCRNAYCCIGCRIAYGLEKRKRERKKKNKVKNHKKCAWCGKSFVTTHKLKKYCRPLCAYHALIRMTVERQRRKRNAGKGNKTNQI